MSGGGLPDLRGTLSYDYDNKGLRGFSSELEGASEGLKRFEVDLKKSSTESERTEGALTKAGAATGALTVAFGAVTAAMLAGVSAAVDYNKSVTLISTLGESTAARFDEYEAGILRVSSALGQDAVTAANAAYNALSSGIEAGDALSFLETASKAATAGVTTVDAASSALTVTLNSFNLSADQATAVSDAMFATANVGVTTFDELAQSFGGVASIAAASGSSYQETLGLLGQITTKGTNTAQAVTEMKAAFVALSKPTAEVQAALEAQGFSSANAAIEANGLQYVLELIAQTSRDTGKPLIELVGSAEAMNAILKTTGENGDSTREKLAAVGSAAGSTAAAFELISETPAHRIAVFRESLQAASISMGQAFLPLLSAMLEAATPLIVGLGRLADVVGGALAGAFDAMPGPLRLVVGALTGLAGVAGATAVAAIGLGLALSPLLNQVGLLEPASKLAQGALTKLTGGASGLGAAMKGALGPIGLLLTAAGLLAEAVGAANAALDEQIGAVDASTATIHHYTAAAQAARDQAGGLAKIGFGVRDSMQVQEEAALRNREAIDGFFSALGRGAGALTSAASDALGLASAEEEVATASKASTQAIIDGANAYLAQATNIDPALLKSREFQSAQTDLNGKLRSGAISADTYRQSLIQVADAVSIAAGGGAVLSQQQQNVAASMDRSFQAALQETRGLSEAALASDAFKAKQAELSAELARGGGNRERATAELVDFARQLTAQDEAYQAAISGNQQFDAAYKRLLADFEAGRVAPVEAIAQIQKFGQETGVAADKVDEAAGRILASTGGISDTLKNAGFQLNLEAVADPDKRAEVLAEADQSAADAQRGIFADMLAARRKLETDLAAAASEGGQSRAAKVAEVNRQIAEAEASGNASRAAELRAGLATELADLDAANADKIAEIKASFEEERQARLAALAQSSIDQLNARLATGEIGEDQALAVFGAIKSAVPDASFIDPAAEATLRYSGALGAVLQQGGATAENLLRVRDSLTNVDASLDTAEANAAEYGDTAISVYEGIVGAAESSAGGVAQAQGAIASSSSETRGALEGDADAESAMLGDRQRGHEETAATIEGSMAVQRDAYAGMRSSVESDVQAAEGSLDDLGSAGETAGRQMASGAVVGKKAYTGVGAAVDRAAGEFEDGADRMVGAAVDTGQRLSGISVDVGAPFEAADAAARGAVDGVREFGREGVAAAEEVASAQSASSGDQASSLDETRGALDEVTGATGEYKGALEALPDDVETEILLDASDAEETLDYLLDQIAQLDGKTFRFRTAGSFVGDGNRMEAGSPLLLLQDLWAIQDVGNRPFSLRGAFSGTGLMGAASGGELGLKEQLDAIYARSQQPVVFTVDGVVDPEFAAFLASIIGQQGVVSSAVRYELELIAQRAADAQRVVDDLSTRIDYLLDSFLRGGEGEPGSLAWLLGQWQAGVPGFDADIAGLFSDLNIPVDNVAQFAALLDQMAAAGQGERALELWNRFYDGIIQRQEEYHAARMADFAEDRSEAEANFEIDKRRIEELIQAYEEEVKKSGEEASDNPQFEGFSDEVDRLEDRYAELLTLLGFDGKKALHDFYREMTGGARDGISNNEHLAEAIDLLGEKMGDYWDGLEADADASHETQMALLDERRRTIQLLLSDQAAAEEALAAIERQRLELLKAAEDAIKAQTDALKKAESEAHRLVMASFDERQRALREEHETQLAFNKARRDAIEEQREEAEQAHQARLDALDAEAAALQAAFDAEERRIDDLSIALERVKLGGVLTTEQARLLREAGIDPKALAEAAKQIEQQESLLDAIQSLLNKIPDSDKPARVRVSEVASDAEKAALQTALDSGLISDADRRIVEVALAGWGVSAERLREILSGVEQDIEDTGQSAVDALNPLDEAQRIIDLMENSQKSARNLLDDQLAAIDVRRQAEEAAWDAERGRYEARIAAIVAQEEAGKAAFDRERQAIEDAKAAEADRHAVRMAQIEAEAALELLRLGHSEEDVQRILSEQRAASERIAAEAATRWAEAMREITQRAREAREEVERQEAAARQLEAFLRDHPPTSPADPVTPELPIDPGGPPGVPPPGPPPASPEFFAEAADGAADLADAGYDAASTWGGVTDDAGILADHMAHLADTALLASTALDPAAERLVDMVTSADRLRSILTDVAGLGAGGAAVAAGANVFVFNGPVTLDAEFAEENGFLSALGTGP